MDTGKSGHAAGDFLTGQRGSIGILMAGLALGIVVLAFIALDFAAVYATRIQGDTAADAAALATVPALEAHVPEAARSKLQPKISAFWSDVYEQVSSQVNGWESGRRAELMQQYADMPEPDRTNTMNTIINQERGSVWNSARVSAVYGRVGQGQLGQALLNGEPLPLRDAAAHFLTPGERGCVIRLAAELGATDMNQAAQLLAVQNGAVTASVEFPHKNAFDAQATSSSPLKLPWFDNELDQDHRHISEKATAHIRDLGGLDISWVDSCN